MLTPGWQGCKKGLLFLENLKGEKMNMIGTIICVVLLTGALGFAAARRSLQRRGLMDRMDSVIGQAKPLQKGPGGVALPNNCPCCGRRMTHPVGMALEVSLEGTRDIPVCSVCLAMGPLDSLIAAGQEACLGLSQ
jgi:hypothetical protein